MVALELSNVRFTHREFRMEGGTRVRERGDYRWYGGSRYYEGSYAIVWEHVQDGHWMLAHFEWFPQT